MLVTMRMGLWSMNALEGLCWHCSAGSLWVTGVATEEGAACRWSVGGTGYHNPVGRDVVGGMEGGIYHQQLWFLR